ncbi:Ras-related protein Rab-32 [Chionoecetes opilio]|uniref:Ras-related protein Rab-32 n=1 Tax=Chionoecetes opilio TaxID=41210 RepID=A0A8J4Y735_CHIOP|nr:Ras-related protein Rab-32 [Chionoecetes opilio]
MSTRPARSTTVVEEVPASGRYSDGAPPPQDSSYTTVPPAAYEQQTPPDKTLDEASTSDSLVEDTYLKLCDNLKNLKLGDSGLSDSLDEFIGRESDTNSNQDSDTGSFYSVQSHLTELGARSLVSPHRLNSNSESTLYDSAQSLQATLPYSLPSPASPFHTAVGREERDSRQHRTSLHILPGQACHSDSLEECTSCPDLSPLEQYFRATTPTLSPSPGPALTGIVTRGTMSTLERAISPNSPRSPKVGEEGEKKKKGLMSSFRKSRKTARKLRQQKKSAEGDTSSTNMGVNSDGEIFDSETSAPNSPACVKSKAVGSHGDGEDTDDTTGMPDSHERLNGSASLKAPRSKSPSPPPDKSTKVEEEIKKFEEKEERKREKSKFGSFLRKEKKIKVDSASKSSLVSTTSAASSQGTDPSQASADAVSNSDSAELKQEEREIVKNDIEQTTTASSREPVAATPTTAATAPPAEAQSSSVQFLKNLTVKSSTPKNKKVAETKTEGGKTVEAAHEKPAETADVKKSVKPASTEVMFTCNSTITTTTSQHTGSSVPQTANPIKPLRVAAASSAASPKPVKRSPGGRASSRSRSPPFLRDRRLSLEKMSLSNTSKPKATERPISLNFRHAVPSPVMCTITPPTEEATIPTLDTCVIATPAARPVANPTTVPEQTGAPAAAGGTTPPSSPEGHAKDTRETPEGDRHEGERNPVLDGSSFNSNSWTNSSIDKREHLYKILVIGELGTGKTSIIKRYVHQFFSQHYRATIGWTLLSRCSTGTTTL